MSNDFRYFDDDRLLHIGSRIEEMREEAIAKGEPEKIRLLSRKADEYAAEINRRTGTTALKETNS